MPFIIHPMPAEVIRILQDARYDEQIRQAAHTLRAGGLVVLPTETVYGVAGLLQHPEARQRLAALRGPDGASNPLTPHLAHADEAQAFLGSISNLSRRMMRKFWPGPVALVFDVPEARQIQVVQTLGLVQSDLYANGKMTLRNPDHQVARDVIHAAGGPVVMSLADTESNAQNGTVRFSPGLLDAADLVLDAGAPRFAKPSTVVAVQGDGYEIVREGVYDARIIQRMLQTTIMFVCSGNTCRSPMAEAIARKVLADAMGIRESQLAGKGFFVTSAGAMANPGNPATPAGVQALGEMEIDLTGHRSRALTVERIHQADLIFTMGLAHARAVLAMVPSASDKVSLLDPEGDIEDPIGGEVELYRSLAVHLKSLIEARFRQHDLPGVMRAER